MEGFKNIQRKRIEFDIKIKWNLMIRDKTEKKKNNQQKIKKKINSNKKNKD